METLQITYKLSLIDARDFSLYLLLKNSRVWILQIITPLIVFFMFYKDAPLWLTLSICVASYIGAMILQVGYIFWCIESTWTKTEHGEIKLLADSDNLQFIQTNTHGIVKWGAVKSVYKTSKFIVINLKDGSMTGVPKRGFLTKFEMDEFYKLSLHSLKLDS